MENMSNNRSAWVVLDWDTMERTAVGSPLACVLWSDLMGRSIMETT
jgi:hypothetical protein